MFEKAETGHSEKYFTEDRNHWFNQDFLDLMAKRWGLSQYSTVLDVGAGMCHWSKLLVPYLKTGSVFTALDKDNKWSRGSAETERYFQRHGASIEFVQGNAHALPFKDNSFDVVTCQTVLIHLKNPELALREMLRVVKKGGIVICSEPNNRIQPLIQDTTNLDDDIDEVLLRVKQNLVYEHFKLKQNNGNNSFGDLLSGTMNLLGFTEIQSYLNDKLVSIFPPYGTVEQQAKINSFLKWGKTDSEKMEFEKEYQYASAQNAYPDFLKNNKSLSSDNKVVKSLRNQTFFSSGASLLYLISGRKEE